MKSAMNNMTATELRELIAAAQQRLEKLDAGKVQVRWAVDWHRADRQKPYLAIIGKAAPGSRFPMEYQFVNEFWKENSRNDSPCHAKYEGALPAGTILKARTGGSMKNEYLNYYIVDAGAENGLREIEAAEALKIVNG